MAADAGFKFPERYLNQQGYKLLNSNHVEEAIQVFDKQKAIHYYKKALDLILIWKVQKKDYSN
ncbi:MAG: hypothetical protein H0U27_08635 [Nitrosopumilus sp.]|nr:hypothetical protein [Nitrosopumilus sp.]